MDYAAPSAAPITERPNSSGGYDISIAHLHGSVTTCDGAAYWGTQVGLDSGEQRYGQDMELAERLIEQGRQEVRDYLEAVRAKLLAERPA